VSVGKVQLKEMPPKRKAPPESPDDSSKKNKPVST